MYKGFHYFANEINQVVVFTNTKWNEKEIARRKTNGFMGIREYLTS